MTKLKYFLLLIVLLNASSCCVKARDYVTESKNLIGELILHVESLNKEYLKNPELSKDVFNKDLSFAAETSDILVRQGIKLPNIYYTKIDHYKTLSATNIKAPNFEPFYSKLKDSEEWKHTNKEIIGPSFKDKKEWLSFWEIYITIYYQIDNTNYSDWLNWMVKRADILPPSKLDSVVMFYLTDRAVKPKKAERSKWEKLLKAKNPVYRLFALKNADEFLDEKEMILSCKNALEEYSHIFHKVALDHLNKIKSDSAYRAVFEYIKQKENDGTCLSYVNTYKYSDRILKSLEKYKKTEDVKLKTDQSNKENNAEKKSKKDLW
jgi:hypothetical protein